MNTLTDRQALERLTLATVSSDNYYDMQNNIDISTDNELREVIACKGNYIIEQLLMRHYSGDDMSIDTIRELLENIIIRRD